MKQTHDFTKGKVAGPLLKMAVPLIATNFIQTAYNITDMIWVGKLGSGAVVSVGTAGFAVNMATALFTLVATGTGIKLAHSIGAKDHGALKQYIVNSYLMAAVLAVLYAGGVFIFQDALLSFFNLGDPTIVAHAKDYLVISMVSVPFMFFNMLYASILNSYGNSKRSFQLNTFGLLANMVLDPLLIFGLGGVLQLGVAGAAWASLIGRLIVFSLSLYDSRRVLRDQARDIKLDNSKIREVMVMGLPFTLQRVAFTGIGIYMAKLIADFGAVGIAVQKIGLQVEAISYMTIGGLYGAVSVFIGQNYGAKQIKRIGIGYRVGLAFSIVFGLFTTGVFLAFARPIFSIFVADQATIAMGVQYLTIIGLSQVFMCMEIVGMASFNGMGKTYVPAAVSLTFTTLRIPLALYLAHKVNLGLDGVWWSISGTSMVKGSVLTLFFVAYLIWKQRQVSGHISGQASREKEVEPVDMERSEAHG